ncbi:MAG TPA: ATP-binding protein [Polyangiaceae bacterium]|nr:ATP-binding protein [Polyangiaceae bacterium]
MVARTSDERYIDLTRGITRSASTGAGVVSLLGILAVWGDWRRMAVVAGTQAAVVCFNTWINLRLLQRLGVVAAEALRALVNGASMLFIAHATCWPVTSWLWLPFVALTFDWSSRVSVAVVVAMCGALDVFALIEHVAWIYPVSFTVFAMLCAQSSKARFQALWEIVERSDGQRHELELAHDATKHAHEVLRLEVAARQAAELELRQAQKLEAVGQLAAGIAHEINTPVQFVGDSIRFLQSAATELFTLIDKWRALRPRLGDEAREILAVARAAEEEADLPFLTEEIPRAISRSLDGVERVATIVRSMKEFAHPDRKEMTSVDLNRALESTLVIARHEYKLVADVELDAGDIPLVGCHPGEVNQVLLNIIINAAHAIADQVKAGRPRGKITIRTRAEGDDVVVAVEDTGGGIAKDIEGRIFEPFFTTKEVGRGTGQGLAIARRVVLRHGGAVTFESRVGVGTTFFVRLPVAPKVASPGLAA